MNVQRIQGNRNVQIQGVENSLIRITYNEGPTHTVPLEPAKIPVSEKAPSPARLVRAHSGVVPYVERGGLLADLEKWIDEAVPFAGRVIQGRGGAGKTKLAVKLCEEVEKSRWLCGFLTSTAGELGLDTLIGVQTPRLVVIDYAENRADQVEMLLPLLAAHASEKMPVRVLLLVRTGSDRTTNWSERLGNRGGGLDAVLERCVVQVLEDTPLGTAEREGLFAAAVEGFTAWLEPEMPPAPSPDLKAEVFENSLMIVIAAYLAAQGEEAPPTREALLKELLGHERRYWHKGSAGLDADDSLLERVVAMATLTDAESEERAAQLLGLISDLSEETIGRRNRLARWVAEQYPGPRWWNSLEPDLLGEHLVAKCFTGVPETLHGVLAGEDPAQITKPLEVLARASADHIELAQALGPILSEEIERLCGVAVAQAESIKDQDLLYGGATTLAAAIDAAISAIEVDPAALPAAVGLMPLRSDVVLSGLAATLTAQEVERLWRPLAAANPAGHGPDLAGSLNNLSNRLGDLGRREEALTAIEEAVEIRRPLADASPAAHGADLAMSLNNLSVFLSGLGRHEEALAMIEESVETYRPLADASPAAHGADLAMSLSNLSNRLADLGRREEALTAIEESVETYRPLAEASPAAYGADLAMSLNNLSNRLGDLGRREEALTAIEEAVETYRLLADASPAAYGADLAMSLNNLAGRLANLGRREEALPAIEESVETYRLLVATNPAVYQVDMASSLNNLSNRLADLGRREEALAAIEESVETYRLLVATNPAVYRADMASSLNNLSNRLADLGRREEALTAIEEAVETYRPLAEVSPAAHGADLAMSLNNLSVFLGDLGRREEALAASEESVAIRRPLADANSAAYAPRLASSLNNLSGRLADFGRHEEALTAIEEAVETYRPLADTSPAAYGADLAMSLSNLSNRLADLGRREEAEDALREATELREPPRTEDAA